jgi:excinuclease ABC subunit C
MLEKILEKTPSYPITKKAFSKIPELPGVYIFAGKNVVYIGKAVNLKSRLGSYLTTRIGPKTKTMIEKARLVSILMVESELEALLLEAELIRKLQPPYNTVSKDDKHPLYIKITKETYPRVITARKADKKDSKAFFGPFPSSSNVRGVLRLLRGIIPFSDHKLGKRSCLYSQIGLCRPCPSVIERVKDSKEKERLKKVYRRNIRMLMNILSRRSDRVLKSLKKTMDGYARNEKYEEARNVRDKLKKLEYILQPITPADFFLENPNLLEDIHQKELLGLRRLLENYISLPNRLRRIECYDVAHLAGTYPTASMVTFIDASPEKSLYRHFRIKQKRGLDDVSSLKEVALRRSKAIDGWGRPDLIVVDGGKAQAKIFYETFSKKRIPIVSLAKRQETAIIPKKEGRTMSFIELRPKGSTLLFLQRLRNEAHRFARRYHHRLLNKHLVS